MAKKIIPPIHLACSDDDLRIAMQYIKIADGIAYATEGHMVVLVNLQHHSDLTEDVINALDGKYVHRDTWKKVMDATDISIVNDEIVYTYGLTKAKFEIASDINFPDVMTVVKPALKANNANKHTVSFQPKFTEILNKIFNSGQLNFLFKDNGPVLVYPCVGAYQYAMLMPIVTTEPYEFDFNI